MSQGTPDVRVRRRPLDRLWIVVADGGRVRVLGVSGDRRGPTVLREMTSVDVHRRNQDLVSDRPGRSFESASVTRHAIMPRHDAHELARGRFIGQIAQMLIEDNRARQFDELIQIVAPDLSSVLRDALDEPTRARVRETVVRDLTKVSPQEIHGRLVEAGLLPASPAARLRLRKWGERVSDPAHCHGSGHVRRGTDVIHVMGRAASAAGVPVTRVLRWGAMRRTREHMRTHRA